MEVSVLICTNTEMAGCVFSIRRTRLEVVAIRGARCTGSKQQNVSVVIINRALIYDLYAHSVQ